MLKLNSQNSKVRVRLYYFACYTTVHSSTTWYPFNVLTVSNFCFIFIWFFFCTAKILYCHCCYYHYVNWSPSWVHLDLIALNPYDLITKLHTRFAKVHRPESRWITFSAHIKPVALSLNKWLAQCKTAVNRGKTHVWN